MSLSILKNIATLASPSFQKAMVTSPKDPLSVFSFEKLKSLPSYATVAGVGIANYFLLQSSKCMFLPKAITMLDNKKYRWWTAFNPLFYLPQSVSRGVFVLLPPIISISCPRLGGISKLFQESMTFYYKMELLNKISSITPSSRDKIRKGEKIHIYFSLLTFALNTTFTFFKKKFKTLFFIHLLAQVVLDQIYFIFIQQEIRTYAQELIIANRIMPAKFQETISQFSWHFKTKPSNRTLHDLKDKYKEQFSNALKAYFLEDKLHKNMIRLMCITIIQVFQFVFCEDNDEKKSISSYLDQLFFNI